MCVCPCNTQQGVFSFLSTQYLFSPFRIKQDLRWHLVFFFPFAVGVCVYVSVYMCVLTVQGGTDGGMWQSVWLRWRMWDSAVGLSPPPRLWPYVALITVWLHPIMTNSILFHFRSSHGTYQKKKRKISNLADKSWHPSQDVWIPFAATN